MWRALIKTCGMKQYLSLQLRWLIVTHFDRALGTVVFALFFHSGIFDHQLGPTITKISRISFTSLAVISIVGSIYLYFKSKNLVKQSIHTPLVDQRYCLFN